MKAIRNALLLYVVSALLSMMISVFILLWLPGHFAISFAFFIAVVFFVVLAFQQSARLRAARLITENELLQTCFVAYVNADDRLVPDAGLEALVSCFGVLLGSRVIRFNMKDNRLWRVEIAKDSITLVYGPKTAIRQLILLHANMSLLESQALAQQFRFETGAEVVIAQDL